MNYINASGPAQLSAIHAGASVLLMPMKPQPSHFYRDIIGKPKPWSQEDWNRLFPQLDDKEIKPPFVPGRRVGVKEKWVDCSGSDRKHAVYPATYTGHSGMVVRPARTMPAWAIRTWLSVISCEPVKLREIGEEDAGKAGFRRGVDQSGGLEGTAFAWSAIHLFQEWWKTQYPRHPFDGWAWRVGFERSEG